MSTVRRIVPRPRAEVFATLLDPRTYPDWLVGAQHIRRVDEAWPAVGTAFHHVVGLIGPFKVPDHSTVRAVDAPGLLSLEVRARPFGRAAATFTLADTVFDGEPATEVEIDEVPIGLLEPATPLIDRFTTPRNRRSLDNLAALLCAGPPAQPSSQER